MFVLEEHHRIVAANCGAQHARDIERSRRHHDAQARAVREDRFAALAVIPAAAGEIAADRDTNHRGRFEVAVGAPARDAEFIAKLHHRGPDIVEELNFRDGFESADGHAEGAPDNRALAKGVLKTRSAPYLRCKPAVALKTPPFPFKSLRFSSRLASATSSPKKVMRSSRPISSESVAATISTIVLGAPCNCGCDSKAREVGSMSGE